MKVRRLSALALLLLFIPTLLTGCWESDLETENEAILGNIKDTEEEEAPPEDTGTGLTDFTLPYFAKKSLDPVSCESGTQQAVSSLLYEGLFVLDETFAPQNVLCESYSYDASSFTYTFTLKEDIVFSDGTPIGGWDVVSTYQRAAQSARYAARFAAVSSMNSSGKNVTLTLTVDNAFFPALLDIPIVKAGTDSQRVPIGSGPYVMKSDDAGEYLAPNESWWQDKTLPVSRIRLSPNSDSETLVYQFNSREIQLLTTDLTGSDPLIVSGNVSFCDFPTSTMLYVGYNTHSALFSDAAVRRAVSLGFDRETVVSAYLSNHGTPASYPFSPVSSLYPKGEENYSLVSFTAAMDELEWGETKPEATLLVNAGNTVNEKIAAYIVSALEDYIDVEILSLPWEEYLARLQSGNFDFYLAQVRMTTDWNSTSLLTTGGSLNYGRYASESMDQYLAGMLSGGSAATAQFYNLFSQDAPIAPLCFKEETVIVPTANVSDISPTVSTPFYKLENWSIDLNA
ncbi:MAG: ABC transporter substrate-binding protein [Oscillospiraceae bacterium]|nr:ABC transporter substrate-binding protein [Oscillospiraceae bacterium]